MKIGLIGQKGIPAKQGGIERHVEELSTRLAEAGFDVTVYSRAYYASPKAKTYKNVKLINLPSIKTKNLDAISHTLFSTLHAIFQNYDIIHYHGVGPSLLSWLPRLLSPQTKVITTFHCLDRKHQKWSRLAKLMLALGERSACLFAHQTITVSKTLKKYCQYKFDRSTIYIPNGVSLNSEPADNSVLAEFGLTPGSYILAAARLVRHKGLHTLIEAYLKIQTDKKLIIAGEGANTYNYVKELKQLASGHPNIILVGEQTGGRLKALFENACLFVQPSEAEGLSIALLEAVAYGRPTIISDIEENLEIAPGFLTSFENKNADDLAQKLTAALNQPAQLQTQALAAKAIVDREYDWTNIISQTIRLYRQPFKSILGARMVKAQVRSRS